MDIVWQQAGRVVFCGCRVGPLPVNGFGVWFCSLLVFKRKRTTLGGILGWSHSLGGSLLLLKPGKVELHHRIERNGR